VQQQDNDTSDTAYFSFRANTVLKQRDPIMAFTQLPPGHTEGVSSLTFTSDNRVMCSTSLDETAILWDMRSHTAMATLKAHDEAVNSCVVFNNSQSLATCSDDNTVRVWDYRRLDAPIYAMAGFRDGVNKMAVSGDSTLMYSACDDGLVYVHKALEGGEPIDKFMVAGDTVNDIVVVQVDPATAAQHDGGGFSELVLTGSEDGAIRSWKGGDGVLLRQMFDAAHQGDEQPAVPAVPDSDDEDGESAANLPDVFTRLIQSADSFEAPVNHITTGNGIVFAAMAESVYSIALDPVTLQLTGDAQVLSGHRDYVHAVLPAANGVLYTVSDDTMLIQWDPTEGKAVRRVKLHDEMVMAAALGDDVLASGCEDSSIRIWQLPLTTETL
jgi:hypothetical protein